MLNLVIYNTKKNNKRNNQCQFIYVWKPSMNIHKVIKQQVCKTLQD